MMSDPAARIAVLERTLRDLETERDELAADVERLCLQGGSNVFDPSHLLARRLSNSEAELRKLKQAITAIEAERNSLQQDLEQLRKAKLEADRAFSERCTELEGDVAFHKNEAAKAVAARNADVERWRAEVENLQLAKVEMESQLRDALGVAEAANKEHQLRTDQLEAELAALREQQGQRDRQDAVAQREARQLREAVRQLEEGSAKLQAELAALREQQTEWERQKVVATEPRSQDQEHEQGGVQQQAQQGERREVEQLREAVRQLEEGSARLKAQLAEKDAKATHAGKLLRQAHKIEDQLNGQIKELKATVAALKKQQGGSSRQSSSGGFSAAEGAGGSPTSPHSRSPSPRHVGDGGGGGGSDGGAFTPPLSPTDSGATPPLPAEAPAAELPHTQGTPVGPEGLEAVLPSGAGPGPTSQGMPTGGALAAERGAEAGTTEGPGSRPGPGLDPDEGSGSGLGFEAGPSAAVGSGTDGTALEAQLGRLEAELSSARAELAAAREELERERVVQEDEREQLQTLRTMVPDFKIKLAQATQEKVEALMRVAELQSALRDAQRAAAAAAGGSGGGGGGGQPIQRLGSAASIRERERADAAASRRSSKDLVLSRSPGSTVHGLVPAASAPSPGAQPTAKSLWTAWLSGGGGGWYGGGAAAPAGGVPAAANAAASGGGAAAAANAGSGPSTYAPSVASASEEGSEADGGGGGAAAAAPTAVTTFSAAAQAAAAAASMEAAEARNRLLSEQLERLRAQLAAVDRMAGRVAERLTQLRACAGLLWSERPEDAPRRWTALGELARLAEACSALRAEAGLGAAAAAAAAAPPPPAAPAAAAASSGGDVDEAGLPPVVPLGADLEGVRQHQQRQPHHGPQRPPSGHGSGGGAELRAHAPAGAVGIVVGGGGGPGGEYDSSLVCTRESGGVQRRVAEVLVCALEFGVRSLERYNHQFALSSVQLYG